MDPTEVRIGPDWHDRIQESESEEERAARLGLDRPKTEWVNDPELRPTGLVFDRPSGRGPTVRFSGGFLRG